MKPTVTPQTGDVDTSMAKMASSKQSFRLTSNVINKDLKEQFNVWRNSFLLSLRELDCYIVKADWDFGLIKLP